jgi:predicted nuclease with TOPRIM domain
MNNKRCDEINNLNSRLDSLENFAGDLNSKIDELDNNLISLEKIIIRLNEKNSNRLDRLYALMEQQNDKFLKIEPKFSEIENLIKDADLRQIADIKENVKTGDDKNKRSIFKLQDATQHALRIILKRVLKLEKMIEKIQPTGQNGANSDSII